MPSRAGVWLPIVFVLLACQPSPPTGEDDVGGGSGSGEPESESSDSDATNDGVDSSEAETELESESETGEPDTWRSALYPENWAPGFADDEGRFLHDFSWAGYHNGEELPERIPGVMLSVIDFGADPSGQTDSTGGIQATIDAVGEAGGGVVHLPAGSYRCDGLLELDTSGVVIRGDGPDATLLWFTRSEGLSGVDHLTLRGAVTTGAELPLIADAEALSHEVWVDDAAGLSVGDSVALGFVITDAFIEDHQMTGIWMSFNGQWRPFFRREVEAIECEAQGCRIQLDVPLRYPALLRDQASLRVESGYLSEVGVEHLAISTVVEWEAAWANELSHAIGLIGVADGWIRDVHSFESPNSMDGRGRHLMSGGVFVRDSKRVTIVESIMARPQNRGDGGNGYLFEISRSNEILTRDCEGLEGRHNFIQNWDFGTSGCVWLRVTSQGGLEVAGPSESITFPGTSEFHHSLAMANLIDSSTLDDGWHAVNRNAFSSGAGHSATQNVLWNVAGAGTIRSFQAGWGYVIGTEGVTVRRLLREAQLFDSLYTEPEDWLEGENEGSSVAPASLYEDQLAKRLGR